MSDRIVTWSEVEYIVAGFTVEVPVVSVDRSVTVLNHVQVWGTVLSTERVEVVLFWIYQRSTWDDTMLVGVGMNLIDWGVVVLKLREFSALSQSSGDSLCLRGLMDLILSSAWADGIDKFCVG